MVETPEKIQFHPGFYGAAELEFRLEAAELEFHVEYNLSKEPLRVDLLIVGKNDDIQLENEVGKIFKRHNIIEYKSPDDGLTVDDLFKTVGYACLYKGLGKTVNQIREDQITVSLFRDTCPQELFTYLRDSGREITEQYPGIYYVKGGMLFDLQIIVMSRLDKEKHSAFRILSKNAKEEDVRRFLEEAVGLKKQGDVANADAVLQVSISANKTLYDKIRGDKFMCKALEELMQDVIEQRVEEKVEERAKKLVEERAEKLAEERAEKLAEERAEKMRTEDKKSLAASLIKLGKLTLEEIASATGLTTDVLSNIAKGC